MKKAIILFLSLVIGGKYAFAQGENDYKNFRFGIYGTPQVTWYKPDDKKKYESAGSVFKFGYGLAMEFQLNKVAVIATGLRVDYDGGRINMMDTAYYFLDKDSKFLTKDDTAAAVSFDIYRLNNRKYNTTYVTIPLTMKLKTPEIGYLTYYGQFGLNSSVRVKGRVDDDVKNITANSNSKQTELDNTSDMGMFKFALNIGGGAEWNLAGSTSLVFGLNWYNGFSNVLKSDSKYLFRSSFNQNAAVEQNCRASAIALTVGVLF